MVEGTLRQIANPHSEKRMELILDQLTKSKSEPKECHEDLGDDEVSIIYYDDHCSCSKAAKCKSSKCICFIREQKCSIKCHISNAKNNCSNK